MPTHPDGNELIPFSDPDASLLVVQQAVLNLWEVVNNLTRLRPKRLKHFHVTIFGSARIEPQSPAYDDVRRLAKELAALGCLIVTGGGPGLMQAANEGATLGDPNNKMGSIGIRIELPFEQGVNAFVGQAYTHRTFFTRLHHFIYISDAFIVVPGGIGTSLETFMVWQLLQVRRLYGTPLVMVGKMWSDLVEWARTHMAEHDPPMAESIDMTIPRCVETINEALAVVRDRYREWQAEGEHETKAP